MLSLIRNLSLNSRNKELIEDEDKSIKKSDIQATLEIATSRNGCILADNKGHFYVFNEDHLVKKFKGEYSPKYMVMLSNGNLAVLYSDGFVNIYNPDSGLFVKSFLHGRMDQYFGNFSAVALPDGRLVIGSSFNGDDIRIYDTNNGELLKMIEFKKLLSWSRHFYFRGVAAMTIIDDIHIAIADMNGHGNIYIYNLKTNALVNQFMRNNDTSSLAHEDTFLGGIARLMTTLKNGNLAVFTTGPGKDDLPMIWIYNPMNAELIFKFPIKQKSITTSLQLQLAVETIAESHSESACLIEKKELGAKRPLIKDTEMYRSPLGGSSTIILPPGGPCVVNEDKEKQVGKKLCKLKFWAKLSKTTSPSFGFVVMNADEEKQAYTTMNLKR